MMGGNGAALIGKLEGVGVRAGKPGPWNLKPPRKSWQRGKLSIVPSGRLTGPTRESWRLTR